MTGARFSFSEAELGAYGEYELQVLERVLRDDRDENLAEVARTICAKIGWEPGVGDVRKPTAAQHGKAQLKVLIEGSLGVHGEAASPST